MGEAIHEQGQGAYGKSLYIPLNLAVNLKVVQKINSVKVLNNTYTVQKSANWEEQKKGKNNQYWLNLRNKKNPYQSEKPSF